jgi:hypothetical protein
MGLKRVSFVAEATFPADDTRDLETLVGITAQAVSDGLVHHGGTLARIAVTGSAVDPDPETPAEDVVIKPPVVEAP